MKCTSSSQVSLEKDNPPVEGLDSDNCFQAEDTVVDQLQAQLPTSDVPSPSSVGDENRNTYTGLQTHHACHTLNDIALLCLAVQCYLQQLLLT